MSVNDYKLDLMADLADRDYAALYLSAAMADSPGAFLVALRDVAEAQQGIGKIAEQAGVNRENLYRMLSLNGNPRLDTLKSVLAALGLQMNFATAPSGVHRRVPTRATRNRQSDARAIARRS